MNLAGTVAGSPGTNITVNETLNAGPLTQAAGSAPPFDEGINPNLIQPNVLILDDDSGVAASSTLLALPYFPPTYPLQTASNVDGGSGSRTTTSTASSLGGTINVQIGESNIVTVSLTPEGLTPFSAIASVTSDGLTLAPDASFPASSPPTLSLMVLGIAQVIPVDFPALVSSVTIPVNVFSVSGIAQGAVTLTSNAVSTYNDGITASVTATTLLVEFDLDVDVDVFTNDIGTYTGIVGGTMTFVSAHASMTRSPVPEPAGAALLLTGSFLTAARRRRAA